MANSTENLLSLSQYMVGCRIERICRILYFYKGVVENIGGQLEIWCGQDVFLLDGWAGGGNNLVIEENFWVDVFDGPLDEETKEYIEETGNYVRIDVSFDTPFKLLIGQVITKDQLFKNRFGYINSLEIMANGKSMWFWVDDDETEVFWSMPSDSYDLGDK
jgi:hypothetical protein